MDALEDIEKAALGREEKMNTEKTDRAVTNALKETGFEWFDWFVPPNFDGISIRFSHRIRVSFKEMENLTVDGLVRLIRDRIPFKKRTMCPACGSAERPHVHIKKGTFGSETVFTSVCTNDACVNSFRALRERGVIPEDKPHYKGLSRADSVVDFERSAKKPGDSGDD